MTPGADILRELLALTPPPPAGDPETVLAAFEAMFDARQDLLLGVEGRLPDTDENRAIVRELAQRDAMWETALEGARTAVGVARTRTSKLRGYAR
jgi:hypothetical protein